MCVWSRAVQSLDRFISILLSPPDISCGATRWLVAYSTVTGAVISAFTLFLTREMLRFFMLYSLLLLIRKFLLVLEREGLLFWCDGVHQSLTRFVWFWSEIFLFCDVQCIHQKID